MDKLPKLILSSTYGKIGSRKLKRKKISLKTLKVYYDTDFIKEDNNAKYGQNQRTSY